MNISNKLTFSRVFLAFICIGFILHDTLVSLIVGFVVFVIASITDFFDGYIARRRKLVTDLGKILDPIADKILTIGVFLAFLQLRMVNAWMISAIMLREFIITAWRLYALNRGVVLAAQRLGKHKTFWQIFGIVLIFLVSIVAKLFPGHIVVTFLLEKIVPLTMWYIVFITLFSGVSFWWANRKAIKTL